MNHPPGKTLWRCLPGKEKVYFCACVCYHCVWNVPRKRPCSEIGFSGGDEMTRALNWSADWVMGESLSEWHEEGHGGLGHRPHWKDSVTLHITQPWVWGSQLVPAPILLEWPPLCLLATVKWAAFRTTASQLRDPALSGPEGVGTSRPLLPSVARPGLFLSPWWKTDPGLVGVRAVTGAGADWILDARLPCKPKVVFISNNL